MHAGTAPWCTNMSCTWTTTGGEVYFGPQAAKYQTSQRDQILLTDKYPLSLGCNEMAEDGEQMFESWKEYADGILVPKVPFRTLAKV
jgi:hypothetical protein